MIDGRSAYIATRGVASWLCLPIAFSEIMRIEALKGPATAIYGFTAFDGIVRSSGVCANTHGHSLLFLEVNSTEIPVDQLVSLSLSPRETETLGWVVQGKTNPEIGLILGISPRTVQKHLGKVYSLLGVENRHAAMTMAIEALRPNRRGKDYD